MKIAIWHNLPSGGGKRALHDHVKGMLALGHHVESWCPPTADQHLMPLSKLVREHIVPLGMGTKTPWSRRLRQKLEPIGPRLRDMAAHSHECARQMKVRGFELLFANSCSHFGAPMIGRFSELPSILYLQEPFRQLYEALPDPPWAASIAGEHRGHKSVRKAIKSLQRALSIQGRRVQLREEVRHAKSFCRVLVNSQFSRESLLRAYGVESRVCYLGVNADQFTWGEVPRKRQIVSLGFLAFHKGADRAIRALAAIPLGQRPSLHWIGNASDPLYRASVEDMARREGVDFRFREKITDAELVRTLHESYAMLYLPRLEPFGYAPLEANCCGLPVVAIAEGGIRETIHEGINGHLVPHDDPRLIADALCRLFDQPALTQAMRYTGREYVIKNWNLSDANEHLEAEFRAVLTR